MRRLRTFALMVLCLLSALVLTIIVFGLPLGESLKLLVEGAVGDKFGLSRTLVKATPLLLTSLGMVVAWRAGMYNIGGEGQFIVGGLAGAVTAKILLSISLPAGLVCVGILVACALGGALWAGIAAWLSVYRGVEVVIGTILLNFISLQILGYAVSGPLQESKHQVPLTEQLPDAAMLPRVSPQMDLHAGTLLALLATGVVFIYLFRTKAGFRLRLVGENANVARANRMSVGGARIQAMLVSGALCGLAGGVEYVGLQGQLGAGFSQQWGFLGIPVALLGGLHPLLSILSALYFGALFAGSENLGRYSSSGATLIYVIQAAAVLAFVGVQAYVARKPVAVEAA